MFIENASILKTDTATEGLKLAESLAHELHRVWRKANPPQADMAGCMSKDQSKNLDLGHLLSVQFSLVAFANNYWKS